MIFYGFEYGFNMVGKMIYDFLMVLNMIFYGFEYDVFMVLNMFSYGGKMIYDFFTVVNMSFMVLKMVFMVGT